MFQPQPQPPPQPPAPADPTDPAAIEAKIAEINHQLLIETKIKIGAENMLQISQSGALKGSTVPRSDVIVQLNRAKQRIAELSQRLEHYQNLRQTTLAPPADAKWRNRAGSTPSDAYESAMYSNMRKAPSSMDVVGLGPDGSRRRSAPQIDSKGRPIGEHVRRYAPTMQDVVNTLNTKPPLEDLQLEALDNFVRIVKQESHDSVSVSLSTKLMCIIPYLTAHGDLVRASAYRALRYLSTSEDSVQLMLMYRIDVYMLRALTRESRRLTEKEQLIKLLRSWIDIAFHHLLVPSAAPPTPSLIVTPPALSPTLSSQFELQQPLVKSTLMRILVALADHPEDKLRLLSIETLAELALSPAHLPLLAQAGGIRSLCSGMLDCPREVTEFIALTLLTIVDDPTTRQFVRRGVDIEIVASAFSDAYGRGQQLEERLASATRAVLALLRHWTGILYLVQDDRRVVRAMVDALRIPYDEHRLAVLSLLQSLFRSDDPRDYSPKPERLDLQGHTTSLLLLVFIKSGLFEALIDLIGQSPPQVMDKATGLIGSLIELCNQLLPEHIAVEVQSLPGLFDLASRFRTTEQVRHRAIAALAHIDESAGAKPSVMAAAAAVAASSAAGGGLVGFMPSGSRVPSNMSAAAAGIDAGGYGGVGPSAALSNASRMRTDQVKVQMGLAMDDSTFRAMLLDSGVLSAKAREYTKWDWAVVTELLQGPLLSARRVDETLKSTKFFKRLASFFRPSKRLFCDLPVNRAHVRFIKIGALFVNCLLMSSEGGRFLADNRLLHDIASALAGVDPNREGSTSHQLLAVSRLEKTLTMGYFTLVGSMAKSEMGLQLLGHFRFFTLFYHLSEISARTDIMRVLIVSLDYSKEGHCRILLSKFLTSSIPDIRVFATQHLGTVLKSSPTPENLEWIVPLLLTQLYDPLQHVQQLAIGILDAACEFESKTKSAIVQLSPTLDHLGEVGNPLFIRLLSTSEGFEYLKTTGYIDKEYARWCDYAFRTYVDRMEMSFHRSIAKTLRSQSPFERGKYDDVLFYGSSIDNGWTLPHFFGELAKTLEGVQLLRTHPHFRRMCDELRDQWQTLATSNPGHVKAILWMIGHIGCTKTGIMYLQDEAALGGDILSVVCDIAAECSVLSVRGTAFHALGLVAKTARGRERLEEYGWVCDMEHGFVLPYELEDLIEIAEWNHNDSDSRLTERLDSVINLKEMDVVSREILEAIAALNNQVLNKTSLRNLMRLRSQYPKHFQSCALYLNVVRLYDKLQFRFAARKFIEDRFDQLHLRNLHLHSSPSSSPTTATSSSSPPPSTMGGTHLAHPVVGPHTRQPPVHVTRRSLRSRSTRTDRPRNLSAGRAAVAPVVEMPQMTRLSMIRSLRPLLPSRSMMRSKGA
ncbi:Rapamycin-insensitive companion of mTOR, middle domain-domain-containing protein [Catenaria anguillulae PL171]|uniref:Rapamycin-insensitive companion of mTOR, middle domain-domain-containing protein n=1 Tax=Catenaria anguillulae PL171 TaxID=765915 RepID=A0A1Y2HBV8_9FUNG|nr:Rapamycin-insensitive companion of mTOR, middle domain-domain-containing protein [Catenaria anguillulae PL171]